MPTFKYDKIVRSLVPSLIEAGGGSVKDRGLTDAEAHKYLGEKVLEELVEVQQAPPKKRAEEFADLLDVSDAYFTATEVPSSEIAEQRKDEPAYAFGFVELGNMALQAFEQIQAVDYDHQPERLAAFQGIVNAWIDVSGASKSQINQIRHDKQRDKGSFGSPYHFIEEVYIPESDVDWVVYHREKGYEEVAA